MTRVYSSAPPQSARHKPPQTQLATMNVDQLHIFREIARCNSVSQASRNLFISQSSLSRTLQNLEQDLSVQLFDRSGKTISLNKYGEILLRYANEAEITRTNTLEKIQRIKEGKNNTIRVLFQQPFGNVPHAFKRVLTEKPEITPYINWIECLEKEPINLEYRVEETLLPGFSEIGKDYFMLACSKRNQLGKKRYVRVGELSRIPFAMYSSSNLTTLVNGALQKHSPAPKLNIEYNCPQVRDALQYVEDNKACLVGVGATILNGIDRDSSLVRIPIIDIATRPIVQYKATETNTGQNQATAGFALYMKEYLEAQIFYDNELYRKAIIE
jgi:DNA-binding transcriptional LysR family regulator